MEDLATKRCVPCEGGVPRIAGDAIAPYLAQLTGWSTENDRLTKGYKFKDFKRAMAWLNQVADVAEAEGHHPDFAVHYNQVDMTIWTHAIGGLSENDFILAAKLDALPAT